MAGRFSICVYNFFETRSTLGEPQLADKRRLRATSIEAADDATLINNPIHAQSQADPNNTLEFMKTIVQTANVEEEAISLKELIPFWFAVSSPLVGILLGLLGAWCVTWLSA
jgi:hypothetical protein